ncbi:MAG: carboxymuconolactone decarboxylase family protein [Dehalococcoidia bacterium]|nr:carboxymuconolactone decarboxylase family protein [Dehalococcoidia bacterium]
MTKASEELVAIGASVGAGCHPCLQYHLSAGREAGLTQDAMNQALADAECVKRSAYNELAVRGRELLGQPAELPAACCDDTNAAKEYVSVGAAVGANSVAQLEKHLGQAREQGIDETQLRQAIEIARNVQHHAGEATARHAERLTAGAAANTPVFLTAEGPESGAGEEACGPDCGCNEESAAEQSSCCGEMEAAVPAGAQAGGKCC